MEQTKVGRNGQGMMPPQNGPRTLGPVQELEKHLPPEWWRSLFNAVYLKTDGDVVENAELTRREVDAVIRASGVGKADRILDLCCGQGRHSLELARRGYTAVTGLDRSRFLVRLARKRAKKEGLQITFREGDARRRRLPEDGFDCVAILGNSFGYFDLVEDDHSVMEAVRQCLRPGGTVVLDLADGQWLRGHFEPRSWEWIDQTQFVCRERSLSADQGRLISREVVVDAERGVIADQFYAERLYDQNAIAQLLKASGFENVRFHGEYETQSDRNQDLGMMARRLWVTAQNGAKRPKKAPSKVPFPDVMVLLGDPRLPDSVKLNGQFNVEDIATVDKLKAALKGLSDYRFSYHDNHATMIATLERERPGFVFNLCDEGFGNDALKELHVVALLELLDIPYTGAGPTCLGMCYDKSLVASIAQALDVPVPLETFISPDELGGTMPSVFPALIKPAQGDSSLGITQGSVVRTPEEAVRYIEKLKRELPGRGLLVQEFLEGAEYSVTVVGNPGLGYTFLPVLEVDYEGLPAGLPKILSYESKWQPDSPYWTDIRYRRSEAPQDLQRAMYDYSTRLFERLGCRDYARFDFRADASGEPKLLEVNPNPGWCWDGKVNLMAEMAEYTYGELLRMILAAAQTRVVAANHVNAKESQSATA